jgi:hypothetical protein
MRLIDCVVKQSIEAERGTPLAPEHRHGHIRHPLLIVDREGNSPIGDSSGPGNGPKDLPKDPPMPLEVVADGSRSSRNGTGVAKCRVSVIASPCRVVCKGGVFRRVKDGKDAFRICVAKRAY